MTALKPLLFEFKCTISFNDEIINIGGHNYLKTTCTLTNSEGESSSSIAYAREDFNRAGMCEAQMTGSSSSYARKYAACGLLAIDDCSQDPDSMDNRKMGGQVQDETHSGPPRKRVSKDEREKMTDEELKQLLAEFCSSKKETGEERDRLSAFYKVVVNQTIRLRRFGPEKLWEFWEKDHAD